MANVKQLIELLEQRGDSAYGGEAVTQLEHALQAASLAEQQQATPELIVAALLHDVGHLLHELPDNAPDTGIDDHHENSAANYLSQLFPPQVTEPIRLHVAAKRYLCATDSEYESSLSRPSIVSLGLQGGRMTTQEIDQFEKHPYAGDAVRLRRWDDEAKIPDHPTPPLTHFTAYAQRVARGDVRL
jgi:phosphonate degradation associated HDIG domain protein